MRKSLQGKTVDPGVTILDCTLRDGSYAIDYQFTAQDTYLLCLGLAQAGFRYIEIGHGTGLGSVRAGKGDSAATDQEYMEVAVSAIRGTGAKLGIFLIPGIGSMADLEMAASLGIDFVRIGTNVTEIDQARPFIERAKRLGMFVSSNLMKSYAVPIDDFMKLVAPANNWGVDIITIVDSAGGMLPSDVREYVQRLCSMTKKAVGFHGHNNLQLALANSLEAVKSGATVVDSSLQGMGRSAGNAQTEVLAVVLEKMGYKTGIDIYKTMDLGERVLKPMMNRAQGVDDISLISGIAQFHSSFMHTIEKVASRHKIDPRRLIMEVSAVDRINVSLELAEKVALKIKEELPVSTESGVALNIDKNILQNKSFGNVLDQARAIAVEITSLSKKTGKQSVFSITLSRGRTSVFPYSRQSRSLVIGNVEAASLSEAAKLVDALDGRVDWILLDEAAAFRKGGFEERIQKSRFSWYSEQRILRLSVSAFLAHRHSKKKVLILADDDNAKLMKISLKQQGIDAVCGLPRKLTWDSFGSVVSFGEEHARGLSRELASAITKDVDVYAVRSGSYPKYFWDAAIKKGNFVCRIDSRAALASELNLVIEAKKTITQMGSAIIAGTTVVAGGVIGRRGAVVVDMLPHPTIVIGIADGQGGLLGARQEADYKESKEKVSEELVRNLYKKEF